MIENNINIVEQLIEEYGDEISLGDLLSELKESLIDE